MRNNKWETINEKKQMKNNKQTIAFLRSKCYLLNKKFNQLNSCIQLSSIECLNEDPKHALKDMILKKSDDPSKYLCSLDDEQLLIKIGFDKQITLKEILIKCSDTVIQEKSYPTKLKIYKNQITMDFSDAEAETPLQEILLTEEDVKGKRIKLRPCYFQRISSVVIFVEENAGFRQTKVHHIELFGSIPDSTNIREWKPKVDENSLSYY